MSVVVGAKAGSERGPIVAAINHSTGEVWMLDSSTLRLIVDADQRYWGWIALVSVSIVALYEACGGGTMRGLALLLGPAEVMAWVLVVLGKVPRLMRQANAVSSAIERLVIGIKRLGPAVTVECLVHQMSPGELNAPGHGTGS